MKVDLTGMVLPISVDYKGKRIHAQPVEREDECFTARYQVGDVSEEDQFIGSPRYLSGEFNTPAEARTAAVGS